MRDDQNQRNSRELLEKAAKCYEKAGWLAEACRVWVEIGEYEKAGDSYEKQELLEKAASCYVKGKNFSKAASCYLVCGEKEKAAECWLLGGETLKAAWVWVSQLKQIYRSQEVLKSVVIETEIEGIERELITAHCEASIGKKRESAKRIKEQLEALRKNPQDHLCEWALTIADVIKRPDLAALIHATAVRASLPDAETKWETWALEQLGDATGVPIGEKEKSYEFEVVKVNRRGEIISKEWQQARYVVETLGNGVEIEMVYIPGGTFTMGSPEGEGYEYERPQHQVTVSPFLMGKYQVTQAQWRVIASRNDLKVNIDLRPAPSRFRGDNRPVERINWYEAVEFCQRLSKLTVRNYQLPSEAQWEYACRAVRDRLDLEKGESYPPFYFGETITTDLVNYYGSVFASEPKGQWRRETTPVGQFPPNAFGLYDMHGNVREWCADDWHSNYDGAPNDGSAWISDDSNTTKVRRGGSYFHNPRYCRSAFRLNSNARVIHLVYMICTAMCGNGVLMIGIATTMAHPMTDVHGCLITTIR